MADKLQDVLASIIERLESGVAPWRQPWANGATPSCPLRADGQPFSGSNAMLLAMIGAGRGCSSPYWLTFQQCLKLEACVRKGSKGAPAILFKTRLVEDEQGEDDRLLKYLKSYVVFNADDVDGLPDSFRTAPRPDPALQAAARDSVIDAIPADVRHGGSKAYYSRVGDFIQLPYVEAFETLDDYRSTRCHEAGHWTGAEHRLNREFGKKFGDQAYAFEELCAEMAACLLGMEIGVRPQMLDSHASYIANWAKILKDRPNALVEAAGHAQRATDYLLAFSRPRSDQASEAPPTPERLAA